jgi:hypothetical protein
MGVEDTKELKIRFTIDCAGRLQADHRLIAKQIRGIRSQVPGIEGENQPGDDQRSRCDSKHRRAVDRDSQ